MKECDTFISSSIPPSVGGTYLEVQLKVDSKGRICLPAEIRDEIGDVVTAKRTSKGILIQKGEKSDFLDEFKRVISSEPTRTGKPENPSPEKMKAIWERKHP